MVEGHTQNSGESSAHDIAKRLQIVDMAKSGNWFNDGRSVQGPVFRMQDPETGKRYYAKCCDNREVELTQKAASLDFPEGTPLHIVPVLSARTADMPDVIREGIKSVGYMKFDSLFVSCKLSGDAIELSDGHSSRKMGLLITEEVPPGASLVQLGSRYTQPEELAGVIETFLKNPMTKEEYGALLASVKHMNQQGVFNNDLCSNMFLSRDADGKLAAHCIDFEPFSLPPSQGDSLVDVSTVKSQISTLIDNKMLAADAITLLAETSGEKGSQAHPSGLPPIRRSGGKGIGGRG